eukprot:365806-Chlamydomonas_euryale.AAC.14
MLTVPHFPASCPPHLMTWLRESGMLSRLMLLSPMLQAKKPEIASRPAHCCRSDAACSGRNDGSAMIGASAAKPNALCSIVKKRGKRKPYSASVHYAPREGRKGGVDSDEGEQGMDKGEG